MRTETAGVTETLIESAKKEFLEHGFQNANLRRISSEYNVPLVKTQMKKIIVTAKTLYSHPKNVSKIYAALHTDLAW